jgi:uncharacterized protein YkwD
MSRPRGGRHRNPAESRRRILLAILLTFGLGTAATSLWALDTPLEETASPSEEATAPRPAESPESDAHPDLQLGDSAVRPQDAEAEPTTEAPARDDPAPDPPEDEPDPEPDRTREESLVAEVNRERSAADCGPLESDAALEAAAGLHAEDMAANDYFSHTSPDGRGPTDRAAEQGYNGGVGENIAAGYPDAASVMEGWMNSKGHRANILNCGYEVIGIGIAERGGTIYWVQKFG